MVTFDNPLLNPRAVAQHLGIGRTKAYALIASGTLPSVRIGRAVRVPTTALQAWIAANTTAAVGAQR